jgi:hypothetical protein
LLQPEASEHCGVLLFLKKLRLFAFKAAIHIFLIVYIEEVRLVAVHFARILKEYGSKLVSITDVLANPGDLLCSDIQEKYLEYVQWLIPLFIFWTFHFRFRPGDRLVYLGFKL